MVDYAKSAMRNFHHILLVILLASLTRAEISSKVGVCYGQLGDTLPSPPHATALISSLKAHRVKLYDANPQILASLAHTNLQVSIMVPNQLIPNLTSTSTPNFADQWIATNVLPHLPQTLIRYLLVGNEILSFNSLQNSTWPHLVPAIRRIKQALKSHNITNIKVGTTLAMDSLQSSFPPSSGKFRSDIEIPIIKPLLQFLNRTKSFFFIDVYPYFPWSLDPVNIRLDYALFESRNFIYTDPVTNLTYTNLLDQMLDSIYFAMEKLGFDQIRLLIAETGWPNGCDYDQIGGNVHNAATYNRNLVKRLTSKPPIGTPARPGMVLPTFLFALFNENMKDGPGTERHWGIFHPNGTRIYEIELNGESPEKTALPAPENDEVYRGEIWCVVAEGNVNLTKLGDALTYACGQGNGTCDPVKKGGKCYGSGDLKRQASYAFSAYWSQFRKAGGSCYFNGLAEQTIKNPSYGACKFPSVRLTA